MKDIAAIVTSLVNRQKIKLATKWTYIAPFLVQTVSLNSQFFNDTIFLKKPAFHGNSFFYRFSAMFWFENLFFIPAEVFRARGEHDGDRGHLHHATRGVEGVWPCGSV